MNSFKVIMVMVLVMPLVFPAHDAGANDVTTPVTPSTTLIGLTPEIVSVATPQLTIEVTDSAYTARQKANRTAVAIQPPKVMVAAAKTSVEPNLEDKRLLAQQAASAFQIDWKVLEAVWQVESGKRSKTSVRSHAGAMGPCQFMAGTWRKYAIDGNGDGVKDVTDARDCLYGAAKLLASNGAASGNVTQALLSYNHSMAYVQKVLRIANSI